MDDNPITFSFKNDPTSRSPGREATAAPVANDLDFGQTIRGFAEGQRVFGRFVLRRTLGRGGMGVVWLGWDERLEEDVALKFMPEMVRLDEVAIKELTRETCKSRQVTHGNIVRIHDFFEDQSTAAISMEFVDGWTLSSLRLQQPDEVFLPDQLEDWVRQLVVALSYAHETGNLIHRDLKPSNLMINSRGQLKVTDFGISSSMTDSVSRLSMRSANSGSPPYMSPQQLLGQPPRVTDDIYSVGATLYELTTGKPPFYRGNIPRQVESVVPPSISERRAELGRKGAPIPQNWERTVAACLEKSPSDRPQSVGEILERLEGRPRAGATVAGHHGLTRRHPKEVFRPLLLGGLLLLVLGLGASWYFGIYQPGQARTAEVEAVEQARIATVAREKAQAAEAEEAVRQEKLAQEKAAKAEAARLANLPGTLRVVTVPEGAQIRVGGADAGTSPATISDLSVGSHSVSLSLPGFEAEEKTVAIEPGATEDPGAIALQRSVGAADIDSVPPGMPYEMRLVRSPLKSKEDVIKTGTTPAMLENLPTGTYSAEITRPGGAKQVSEFSVMAGQTARVRVEFPAVVPVASPDPNTVFSLEEIFDDTQYDQYNSYSRTRIVRIAQEKLKNAGFYVGALDGALGRGTQTAIRAWQEKNGLQPTGRLDQETQRGLGLVGLSETRPPSTPAPRPARSQAAPRPAPTVAPTPVPTPAGPRDITVDEFMQKARELRN